MFVQILVAFEIDPQRPATLTLQVDQVECEEMSKVCIYATAV